MKPKAPKKMGKLRGPIRGAGGGDDPPQPRSPNISPDTLSSTATLRIVDVISEGEIEGLVDGYKSIYMDETPVQAANGAWNFGPNGVIYDARNGTQSQSYIPDFTSVENEVEVNVEAKAAVSIVRQITNPNVNRIRVRIMVPSLSNTDGSTGDVGGTSVTVSLWIQPSGGSYQQVAARPITGKSSSRYEVTLETPLTGQAPWNVKLVRDTADSTSDLLQNKTYFESYTEVIDAKLKYPNSAIVALKIDSTQFQSVPKRAYDVKLLKIKIPSNYDPIARTYSGAWDGTFHVAWSDNPAWVFYDLVTNSRYGLGVFVPESQVDKWGLYEIAKYCDALVPDGFGGTEPRFTCNLMLSDAGGAYDVLQSLASVFRGMVYWAAGSVTVSQDAPQDPAYLFSPANVVDGRFSYQGASAKTRHSVALVSWNDPNDFYRQKVEYVEDQDAIARFGVQQTEIAAFGCTSRGQAHRLGKWLLYTEQNESEVVAFKAGLEGIVGRPGQVIKIADPVRAGARMGGRISSATTKFIGIDSDLAGSIGGDTLSVLLPNGTVEDRAVVGISGRTLEVQPDFSLAPNAQAPWILKSADILPQTYRVIAVKEESAGVYAISAIRHDPDKYAAVENDLVLEPKSYSNLRAMTDPPGNIKVTEALYQAGSLVRSKAVVSWDKVDRAVSYVVKYRFENNNFIEMPEVGVNEQEILDTQPGSYEIQVSAVNSVGKRSVPTTTIKELYGKTLPPSDVSGFSMIPNAGQAYLTWDQATDLDVLVGGQVRIRHTPRTVGQAWADAVDIIPAVAGTTTSAVAPLLSGTYMAKFVDSSGIFSDSEVIIITTIPYALALNVVNTQVESPGFAGTRTNMIVDTLNGALVLADTMLVDDYPAIDSVHSWDFPGNIAPEGSYRFQNTIDLGGVWPSNISSKIDLQAFGIGTVIDSRIDPIDSWQDIDGSSIDDVNADLFVRSTEDDPNATSPAWTDWKRIRAGSYSARGYQFELRCTSGSRDHNLFIKDLEVTIDMDDRTVAMGPLTSGTGTSYRVTYPEAFFDTPVVSITANNMVSGDHFTISSSDKTGFNVVFSDSTGTTVSRVFNVIAKGYGRKVA